MRRVVAGVALFALAGCGGGHGRPPQHPAGSAATGFLAPAELRRDLGNAFRAGLDRLALMSQPPDEATTLATDLPKGLLDRVTCTAARPRPAAGQPWPWQCRVRWQSAGGRERTTSYAVQLLPTRCFAATAEPAFPAHRDTTIATYSEHPLNTFVSLKHGC